MSTPDSKKSLYPDLPKASTLASNAESHDTCTQRTSSWNLTRHSEDENTPQRGRKITTTETSPRHRRSRAECQNAERNFTVSELQNSVTPSVGVSSVTLPDVDTETGSIGRTILSSDRRSILRGPRTVGSTRKFRPSVSFAKQKEVVTFTTGRDIDMTEENYEEEEEALAAQLRQTEIQRIPLSPVSEKNVESSKGSSRASSSRNTDVIDVSSNPYNEELNDDDMLFLNDSGRTDRLSFYDDSNVNQTEPVQQFQFPGFQDIMKACESNMNNPRKRRISSTSGASPFAYYGLNRLSCASSGPQTADESVHSGQRTDSARTKKSCRSSGSLYGSNPEFPESLLSQVTTMTPTRQTSAVQEKNTTRKNASLDSISEQDNNALSSVHDDAIKKTSMSRSQMANAATNRLTRDVLENPDIEVIFLRERSHVCNLQSVETRQGTAKNTAECESAKGKRFVTAEAVSQSVKCARKMLSSMEQQGFCNIFEDSGMACTENKERSSTSLQSRRLSTTSHPDVRVKDAPKDINIYTSNSQTRLEDRMKCETFEGPTTGEFGLAFIEELDSNTNSFKKIQNTNTTSTAMQLRRATSPSLNLRISHTLAAQHDNESLIESQQPLNENKDFAPSDRKTMFSGRPPAKFTLYAEKYESEAPMDACISSDERIAGLSKQLFRALPTDEIEAHDSGARTLQSSASRKIKMIEEEDAHREQRSKTHVTGEEKVQMDNLTGAAKLKQSTNEYVVDSQSSSRSQDDSLVYEPPLTFSPKKFYVPRISLTNVKNPCLMSAERHQVPQQSHEFSDDDASSVPDSVDEESPEEEEHHSMLHSLQQNSPSQAKMKDQTKLFEEHSSPSVPQQAWMQDKFVQRKSHCLGSHNLSTLPQQSTVQQQQQRKSAVHEKLLVQEQRDNDFLIMQQPKLQRSTIANPQGSFRTPRVVGGEVQFDSFNSTLLSKPKGLSVGPIKLLKDGVWEHFENGKGIITPRPDVFDPSNVPILNDDLSESHVDTSPFPKPSFINQRASLNVRKSEISDGRKSHNNLRRMSTLHEENEEEAALSHQTRTSNHNKARRRSMSEDSQLLTKKSAVRIRRARKGSTSENDFSNKSDNLENLTSPDNLSNETERSKPPLSSRSRCGISSISTPMSTSGRRKRDISLPPIDLHSSSECSEDESSDETIKRRFRWDIAAEQLLPRQHAQHTPSNSTRQSQVQNEDDHHFHEKEIFTQTELNHSSPHTEEEETPTRRRLTESPLLIANNNGDDDMHLDEKLTEQNTTNKLKKGTNDNEGGAPHTSERHGVSPDRSAAARVLLKRVSPKRMSITNENRGPKFLSSCKLKDEQNPYLYLSNKKVLTNETSYISPRFGSSKDDLTNETQRGRRAEPRNNNNNNEIRNEVVFSTKQKTHSRESHHARGEKSQTTSGTSELMTRHTIGLPQQEEQQRYSRRLVEQQDKSSCRRLSSPMNKKIISSTSKSGEWQTTTTTNTQIEKNNKPERCSIIRSSLIGKRFTLDENHLNEQVEKYSHATTMPLDHRQTYLDRSSTNKENQFFHNDEEMTDDDANEEGEIAGDSDLSFNLPDVGFSWNDFHVRNDMEEIRSEYFTKPYPTFKDVKNKLNLYIKENEKRNQIGGVVNIFDNRLQEKLSGYQLFNDISIWMRKVKCQPIGTRLTKKRLQQQQSTGDHKFKSFGLLPSKVTDQFDDQIRDLSIECLKDFAAYNKIQAWLFVLEGVCSQWSQKYTFCDQKITEFPKSYCARRILQWFLGGNEGNEIDALKLIRVGEAYDQLDELFKALAWTQWKSNASHQAKNLLNDMFEKDFQIIKQIGSDIKELRQLVSENKSKTQQILRSIKNDQKKTTIAQTMEQMKNALKVEQNLRDDAKKMLEENKKKKKFYEQQLEEAAKFLERQNRVRFIYESERRKAQMILRYSAIRLDRNEKDMYMKNYRRGSQDFDYFEFEIIPDYLQSDEVTQLWNSYDDLKGVKAFDRRYERKKNEGKALFHCVNDEEGRELDEEHIQWRSERVEFFERLGEIELHLKLKKSLLASSFMLDHLATPPSILLRVYWRYEDSPHHHQIIKLKDGLRIEIATQLKENIHEYFFTPVPEHFAEYRRQFTAEPDLATTVPLIYAPLLYDWEARRFLNQFLEKKLNKLFEHEMSRHHLLKDSKLNELLTKNLRKDEPSEISSDDLKSKIPNQFIFSAFHLAKSYVKKVEFLLEQQRELLCHYLPTNDSGVEVTYVRAGTSCCPYTANLSEAELKSLQLEQTEVVFKIILKNRSRTVLDSRFPRSIVILFVCNVALAIESKSFIPAIRKTSALVAIPDNDNPNSQQFLKLLNEVLQQKIEFIKGRDPQVTDLVKLVSGIEKNGRLAEI